MGDVHELRIHGVNNTAPHDMLGVPADAVHRVTGTDSEPTGFWDAPKHPPCGCVATREAYSWGGVNSAPTATGRSLPALRRALWIVLLPAALVNVAYWSRPSLTDRAARTGRLVCRFAGLLLTALVVTAAADIGVDQIGWQCFRGGNAQCDPLPSWVGFLANGWWAAPGRRLMVGAVVPLLLLVVLYFVSKTTLQRYESFPDVGTITATAGSRHVLEEQSLWNGKPHALALQRLHVATGLFLVVLLTGWPVWHATARNVLGPFGVDDTVRAAVAGLALVVVVTIVQCGRGPEKSPTLRWGKAPGWLLGLACVVTIAHVWAMLRPEHELNQNRDLLGYGAAPVVILLVLCGLVLVAFLLRWGALVAVGVPVLVAAAAFGAWRQWPGDRATIAIVGPLLLVAGCWVVHTATRCGDARDHAWHGAAPAMLLGAAVLIAALFTTSAVLLAGDRLNGGDRVTALEPRFTSNADQGQKTSCTAATFDPDNVSVTCTKQPVAKTPHVVPIVYLWLAPALPLVLIGWVLVAGGAIVVFRRSPVTNALHESVAADYPSTEPVAEYQRERVVAARRSAALAHRAERVIGMLAPLTAALVLVALMGALLRAVPWQQQVPALHRNLLPVWAGAAGLVATSAAAAGLIALGGFAYRSPSLRRTIGIVWDLTSFWPRAAHPFAPPCYAERGVPEIVLRARWRLDRAEDRLLLSAHSLGCLLAVAAFFRLDVGRRKRVLLITYGCQLRAYFSRIFPAVLGPEVLGIAPAPQAELCRESSTSTPAAPAAGSLAGQLDAPRRWRNLTRPSDYLGFRAYDDVNHTVDRRVPETKIPWGAGDPQPGSIDDHGDYPGTDEYKTAVAELIGAGCCGDCERADAPPNGCPPIPVRPRSWRDWFRRRPHC